MLSVTSRTIHPSFSCTTYQNVPGISDYILKYPMFNTIHSCTQNVAFLLAVSMNPPISCHSKQQPFTATNYTVLINSFLTIAVSPLQFHLLVILVYSLPRPRNILRHALCPFSTVCKSNSPCVMQQCRFTRTTNLFQIFLESGSGSVVGIKYPSTVQIVFVHIFSHEFGKFPFFLELSRPFHRGCFMPTD